MPTLLLVNNYHYRRGGADAMYLDQGELFREAGWDVVEFAMHHPSNLDSDWSQHFVDEIEVGSSYSVVGTIRRAGRVVWSRQAQQRLGDLLDRVRPDVAHLHNVYHHLSPSVLPTLHRRGIPVVLTTHDLKLACPSYKMLTHDGVCERCKGGRLHNVVRHRCIKESVALSSIVLVESALHRTLRTYERHVDRFVTPSRFYLDTFADWGLDPDRFVHIPNYVRIEQYRAATDAGNGFVYFGRLGPEKGLATLVQAAAAAGVALRIVGTGPEEPALRQLRDRLGANVELLGYRSGGELHDLVRSARAAVLPSEWYENAPVSVLEAYALGTPVIGARIGGIGELVRDGETGMTVESGSVDALAEALARLEAMPDDEVAAMGRAGRRWVEDDFDAPRYLDRILDLYADLDVVTSVAPRRGTRGAR